MLKNKNRFFQIILISTFVIFLFACTRNPNEFKVSGKLDNVNGPYLFATYEKNDSLIVDTIAIDHKGEFSFTGLIDTLSIVSLYFNQEVGSPNVYIFVDKGWDVTLKGDLLYPDLIAVNGGNVNNDLTMFKEKNKDILKSRSDILNKILDKKNQSVSTNSEKDYGAELKRLNFELSNIAAQYVKDNPDKIASVIIISAMFKDENLIPRLDESLDLLKKNAATFPLVEELRAFSAKVKETGVGSVAPNFILKDINGKNVSLTNYRGKYLVLAFLSTTCDACNIERKDAIALYNSLKEKKENIDIISVIIDNDIEPFSKATLDSIKWTLLPEYAGWASPVFELYNIQEVPYNILISPTGTILDRDFVITELPERFQKQKDIAANGQVLD